VVRDSAGQKLAYVYFEDEPSRRCWGVIAVRLEPQVRSVQEETRVAGNLTSKPPISGAQIRAARALLKWSVRELSEQCRVSQSAISRGERVNGTPLMQVRTLSTIRLVLKSTELNFSGSTA
jgi:hypothetical protein